MPEPCRGRKWAGSCGFPIPSESGVIWHPRPCRASEGVVENYTRKLESKGFESDGYVICLAASIWETFDEANAQDNCVTCFIDKCVRGMTEIWRMRRGRQPRRIACHHRSARRACVAGVPEPQPPDTGEMAVGSLTALRVMRIGAHPFPREMTAGPE